MLRQAERALSAGEVASLRSDLTREQSTASGAVFRFLAAAALVCAPLGALTVLASDAPWPTIVVFWTVVALVIGAWVGIEPRRTALQRATHLRAALDFDRVRVLHATSTSVAEFEEFEDEGACWAFQVEPDVLLFITGQAYYADAQFPNSDFEIIEPLLPSGLAVNEWLVAHGTKLAPERRIPASVKLDLELPEHLEAIVGTIPELEQAAAQARHSAKTM